MAYNVAIPVSVNRTIYSCKPRNGALVTGFNVYTKYTNSRKQMFNIGTKDTAGEGWGRATVPWCGVATGGHTVVVVRSD